MEEVRRQIHREGRLLWFQPFSSADQMVSTTSQISKAFNHLSIRQNEA